MIYDLFYVIITLLLFFLVMFPKTFDSLLLLFSKRLFHCGVCGGSVKLSYAPKGTKRIMAMGCELDFPLVKVPCCQECGETWMNPEDERKVDLALMSSVDIHNAIGIPLDIETQDGYVIHFAFASIGSCIGSCWLRSKKGLNQNGKIVRIDIDKKIFLEHCPITDEQMMKLIDDLQNARATELRKRLALDLGAKFNAQ